MRSRSILFTKKSRHYFRKGFFLHESSIAIFCFVFSHKDDYSTLTLAIPLQLSSFNAYLRHSCLVAAADNDDGATFPSGNAGRGVWLGVFEVGTCGRH